MDILTLAIAKNKFGSANETITTENITNALGYKPANQEEMRKLSKEKAEKDAIPTKTSQLTNDSDFQTGEQVRAEIEKMTHLTFKKVDTIEEAVKQNVIYLIPNKKIKEDNIFDEYLLIDGVPELIGSTAIDLSGYALKTEIPTVPETLPNPNPLTFTGAVTGSYDGSKSLIVEIPAFTGDGSSLQENGILIHSVTVEEEINSLYIDVDYNKYKCVYATVYSAKRNENRNLFIGINKGTPVVSSLNFYNAATILIMPITKNGHVFISYDTYKGNVDEISSTGGYSRQGVAVKESITAEGIRISTSNTFVVGDIINIYGVER